MSLKATKEVEALFCPFCKSDELAMVEINNGECSVECKSCSAEGPVKPTPGEAVEAWNVRTYYSGKRKAKDEGAEQ